MKAYEPDHEATARFWQACEHMKADRGWFLRGMVELWLKRHPKR